MIAYYCNRISADAGLTWQPTLPLPYADEWNLPCARNMIRNTINRLGMHGAWWINDPDCLLLREDGTTFTDDEIRGIVTVKAFSGGSLIISDDLKAVPERRLAILAKVLPCTNLAAIAVDLLDKSMPEVLRLELTNGDDAWSLVAACNWATIHATGGKGPTKSHSVTWSQAGLDKQLASLQSQLTHPDRYMYCLHIYEFWTHSYFHRLLTYADLADPAPLTLGPVPHHSALIYAFRLQALPLPGQGEDGIQAAYLGSNIHFSCGLEVALTAFTIHPREPQEDSRIQFPAPLSQPSDPVPHATAELPSSVFTYTVVFQGWVCLRAAQEQRRLLLFLPLRETQLNRLRDAEGNTALQAQILAEAVDVDHSEPSAPAWHLEAIVAGGAVCLFTVTSGMGDAEYLSSVTFTW